VDGEPAGAVPDGRRYLLDDAEAQRRYTEERSAADALPFLLPHLRPGMRVVDCGCGHGSITLGLAELVAPGEVVGIDRDPDQLREATASAAARGLGNVRFEAADAYALPLPDGAFDVAVAHTLLIHLPDPLRGARELRRVLRPGGIAAIADGDFGSVVFAPASPLVSRGLEVYGRVFEDGGAHWHQGREARRVLREAGFARVEGHATVEYYGDLAGTRRIAGVLDRLWGGAATVETVVRHGWAEPAELEAMRAAVRAWGEEPDAFFAVLRGGALGWAG